MKVGVLLVNLGTPDNPTTPAVRRYLREFLMDGRVIDIPKWQRFLLVQGIIAPFRAPKSAKVYQALWTKEGSPLLIYGYAVQKALQDLLGSSYYVALGMRYQKPSIAQALKQLKEINAEKIIILPLFPQYASATTGSVHEKVMEIVRKWSIIPEITFIAQYCNHQGFIEAFAQQGRKYLTEENFDHVIFSYHGLPERQITKHDTSQTCLKSQDCCTTYTAQNRLCYRAQCFETSRKLAEKLSLRTEDYTVSFQSRLGKSLWIQPYTDETIKKLVKQEKKRVLVFSPSFVADCLETTIEIGIEYRDLFESLGGERWQLVESLNDSPLWIETLKSLVEQYT
ncbi:MAG: ferrochelatase [Bacteroidia bacterium]|nr:ferrochelatase [Bacteroidia bacterium]MDW8348213.1 ferrochelatase [Bacteroidia bacterium]